MANEVKISKIQVKRAYNYTNISADKGFLLGEPVYVCDQNTLYIGNGCDKKFPNMKHIAEDLCVCDGTNQIFHLMGANTNKAGSLRIGGFCATCEGIESLSGKTKLVFGTDFEGVVFSDSSHTLKVGGSGIHYDSATPIPLDASYKAVRNGADFVGDGTVVTNPSSDGITKLSCDGVSTDCNGARVQSASWRGLRNIFYGSCSPSAQGFDGWFYTQFGVAASEGDIYICL